MTKRLIETWLPIAALGEESVRERRSMTALPPTYYLHVWWARRPLVASRAAIVASLLPEDSDRNQFMRVLGIHGDPVAVQKRIKAAKRTGDDLGPNVYGYRRAFSYSPTPGEIQWLASEAKRAGHGDAFILDPSAGGGSIPFEALRMGFSVHANDLNPVAALILRQTLDAPFRYGLRVLTIYQRISSLFLGKVLPKYEGIFPLEPDGNTVDGYLWARTIRCPYCEGLIPLSPNWRLAGDGRGVKLVPDEKTKRCGFEIVRKAKDQSEPTVAKGDAKCPFPSCGRVVDGDIVKRQAQNGEMGDQLFAIVYKRRVESRTRTGKLREKRERAYRTPRPEDDNGGHIRRRLQDKADEWEALNILPTEAIDELSNYDRGHRLYGMRRWVDLFSPRQLLCHGTSVEAFREVLDEEKTKGNLDEPTKAAFAYLSFALDKMLDYNSRMSAWIPNREVMEHSFKQHNYSIKWSFAEMAPLVVGYGYEWVLGQVGKCISELVSLARPDTAKAVKRAAKTQTELFNAQGYVSPVVTISCRPGDSLSHIATGSVDAVVMDPPYYDNVMYAELSDFFYVWLKRTAGYVYPEWFTRTLTDKENEAVANSAKFAGLKRSKAMAGEDYRQRMATIFGECRRVLKDDGILTLMFTHKATGAWDALTSGLLDGGFTITASWPINTEAEGSLHIKQKAAANSTVFLVCRPRYVTQKEDAIYWEDVEPLVAKAVRERVKTYQEGGIRGVDLYLACFGPALEEFAKHWPLTRGKPKIQLAKKVKPENEEVVFDPYSVTPEDALDAARREVKRWRLEELTHLQKRADLDPVTEWFVLAWDAYRAPEFPYDEGLRLARVVGVDLDGEIIGKIAEKKGSEIILWDSAKRAAKGSLGPTDGSHAILDALHHAAHIGRTRTLEAARELLEKSGADKHPAFLSALEAVLEVLPVSKTFTKIDEGSGVVADAASDFDALEHLRRLAFSDKVDEPQQLKLWEDT